MLKRNITSTTGNILTLQSLNVDGIATVSASLHVKENTLIEGILTVIDSITTKNLFVTSFAQFFSDVVFKGNVAFEGRPTFNSDTAGFAVITKDADRVEVLFEKEYEKMPLITASIAIGDKDENFTDRKTEEREGVQEALEHSLLQNDIQHIITRRTTKGFVIKLNKNAPEDISFSWVALAIKDAKTSLGKKLLVPQSTIEPSPTLAPQATASAQTQ